MTSTHDAETPVTVTYTNWKGETAIRRLLLSGAVRFGTTEWHQTPAWLISAFDVDHPAWIWKEYDLSQMDFTRALPVQKYDADTVERVAKAIWGGDEPPDTWETRHPSIRGHHREQARSALSAMPPQEVSVQEAARVLLDNCPNPIFDNLKYALIGEFKQSVPSVDEDGEEVWHDRVIEWTTTKLIIKAALRALSEKPQ
tara:strand:- start:6955 stop:7551 length:597 start_codon:yes stop_codon:yes gene_type:complete